MDHELDQANDQQDLADFLDKLSYVKAESDPSESLNAIKKQHWYFINFQTFCKSEVNPDPTYDYSPYFVLAEVKIYILINVYFLFLFEYFSIKVALLEFSLEEGIIDEYHAFIKPNKIPLGYTSQCMDCSKEVSF